MKLEVLTPKEGDLWVPSNHRNDLDSSVPVNLENVLEWYPFNFLYYYEENNGDYYLKRQRRARYAVYGSSGLKDLSFYMNDWSKPHRGFHPYVHKFNAVYNRNKEVVNFGHHLGIKLFGDVYLKKDVENGFHLLSRWQEKTKQVILEHSDHFNPLGMDSSGEFGLEEHDQYVFSLFSPEDDYNYQLSGEVYAMLVLMNKILKAG